MTDDRIELVDREYGQSVEERPARQIRTRLLSFHNIKAKFNAFRIARLQGKLDHQVEKALTGVYTEDNYDKKLGKSANIIARLEEKIMILSKQDVPAGYVSRRAIKLRKNMIDNLKYHTTNYYGSVYSIGLENRDAIMAPEMIPEVPVQEAPVQEVPVTAPVIEDTIRPVVEIPAQEVPVTAPVVEDIIRPVIDLPVQEVPAAAIPNTSDEIDVEKEELDKQGIRDVINEEFNRVREENAPAALVEDIPTMEVEDVPNKPELEVSDNDTKDSTLEKELIRQAVEEAFRKIHEEQEKENVPVVETPEVKISKNNEAPVHTDHYDENGERIVRRKKYNYTPMTDEEIREAQIKLGFDEHGNLVEKPKKAEKNGKTSTPHITSVPIGDAFNPSEFFDKFLRDKPVVVPDREIKTPLDLVEEEPTMFDIIPQEVEKATFEEVTAPKTENSNAMTIDDYESLREKILKLKDQQEESQRKKDEARRRAEEAAAAAEEAKAQYEESQARYMDRMNKLFAYAESLEAACDENERGIAEAEDETKEKEGFAQTQRQQIDKTNQIVSEIDLMMQDHPEIFGDSDQKLPIKR